MLTRIRSKKVQDRPSERVTETECEFPLLRSDLVTLVVYVVVYLQLQLLHLVAVVYSVIVVSGSYCCHLSSSLSST